MISLMIWLTYEAATLLRQAARKHQNRGVQRARFGGGTHTMRILAEH